MFQPVDNGHPHSIREAVFVASFQSPHRQEAMSRLLAFGQENWKGELPAVAQGISGAFPISPLMPFQIQGSPSAAFQVFKPDGSIKWRVLAADNFVAVNCLDYTGWEDVFPRALEYLKVASNFFSQESNGIVSLSLQYINHFHWVGSQDDVTPSALISRDSKNIPPSFWFDDKGAEWHINQGSYRKEDRPVDGRVLSVDNLAGQIERPSGRPIIVIDLLRRFDLATHNESAELFFESEGPAVNLFGHLRKTLRTDLRSYLVDDVLAAIRAEPLT